MLSRRQWVTSMEKPIVYYDKENNMFMLIVQFLFWLILALWFFGVKFQYIHIVLGILALIIALALVLPL